MNDVDDATLAKLRSDAAEKRELLIRKKWLLQKHPDFKKELKEIALAAGKSLKCKGSFVDNGINRTMILDFLHWDNLKELDKHGTPRHAFMVQYELIPEPRGAGALTWELGKLRKLAKYADLNTEHFWRNVSWYELKEQGKTSGEIATIILEELKNDWISLDIHVLLEWQKSLRGSLSESHRNLQQKPVRGFYKEQYRHFKELCENFERLCKTIGVVPFEVKKQHRLDRLKLLYYLGRFKLGQAKGNLGEPTGEYPPLMVAVRNCKLKGFILFTSIMNGLTLKRSSVCKQRTRTGLMRCAEKLGYQVLRTKRTS